MQEETSQNEWQIRDSSSWQSIVWSHHCYGTGMKSADG